MKSFTRNIVISAMIAAIYAVMTLFPPFSMFSYGLVQFRISEALMLLCLFSPCGVWGCFIGCLIANIFTPLGMNTFDLIFGSLATLLSGFIIYKFRGFLISKKYLAPLPVIIINAVVVGFYLPILLGGTYSVLDFFKAIGSGSAAGLIAAGNTPIIIAMLSVALGEAAVTYLIGIPFSVFVQKHNFFSKG